MPNVMPAELSPSNGVVQHTVILDHVKYHKVNGLWHKADRNGRYYPVSLLGANTDPDSESVSPFTRSYDKALHERLDGYVTGHYEPENHEVSKA